MQDLEYALKEKQTEEHTVIDEATRDQAEVYSNLMRLTGRDTLSSQFQLV